MGTDDMLIMAMMGLMFGESAGRLIDRDIGWIKVIKSGRGIGPRFGTEEMNGARPIKRERNYLEKIAKEYEIIPLMSKLL